MHLFQTSPLDGTRAKAGVAVVAYGVSAIGGVRRQLARHGRHYLYFAERQGELPACAGVLLVSSIAGVIIHIPAGIGVLEAVFVAMLHGQSIFHGTIITALLAYRAIYFIAPLLLAIVLYLGLESRAKNERDEQRQAPDGDDVPPA